MNILILEPNTRLVAPYSYLGTVFNHAITVQRVESIELGVDSLTHFSPNLVLVSTSFEVNESLKFVEAFSHSLKKRQLEFLPPLVFVVDVKHPLSTVLGTAWGGRSAVISTQASFSEFKNSLMRIMKEANFEVDLW